MTVVLARIFVMNTARRMGMQAEILDVDEQAKTIVIRLTTPDFRGLTHNKRWEVVDRAFRTHALVVATEYNLIFETWTPNEILTLALDAGGVAI